MNILKNKLRKQKLVMLMLITMVVMLAPIMEAQASVAVKIGDLVYWLGETEASVAFYEGTDSTVEIPESITYEGSTYTITAIESGVFEDNSTLTAITIPNTVTNIGNNAFNGCTALQNLTLHNVSSLGEFAFFQCNNLQSVVISNGMDSVGDCAFSECTALQQVTFLDGCRIVGESMFSGCTALKEIQLTDTIESIGGMAFNGCSALKKITIPKGVTVIEGYTFYKCSQLKQVNIPDTVVTIKGGAFYECTSLEVLVFPESVTSVSSSMFFKSTNLKTFCYPAALKEEFADGVDRNTVHVVSPVQISYTKNADGTVSLNVDKLPDGTTSIALPENIDGKTIKDISGLDNVNVEIKCSEHTPGESGKDMDNHWHTCTVCKNDIKEPHNYGTGSAICKCGYVPFVITMQPSSLTLRYGKSADISVAIQKTMGAEQVSYQWFENEAAISGAATETYSIPTEKAVGTYTYTCKVTCSGYVTQTEAVTVTVKALAKGSKYQDDNKKATYKITKALTNGKGTVEYVKPTNKKKSKVTIPATVKIGGVSYKVTSIAKNAFKGNRSLRSLAIEKNVNKIGAKAFYGCNKLKTIKIKTTKLKVKKVGANAFKKINAKVTIKVPKKKMKAYKSMIQKKGIGEKARFKKL